VSIALDIARTPLGDSGLSIPRVALGCGNFGGIGSVPELFGEGLDRDGAFAVMDAAWEAGLDHFDTADAYGGGASETMMGEWMASRGVRPMLTTKTYNPMDAGADCGLAPERITRQLQSSLQRLGVDSVDLYLCHEFDPLVPVGDSFAVLDDAVDGGAIGAYGVSNFSADQLNAALAAGAPAAVQNSFSLLDRADEHTVVTLCDRAGIAYIAFGPLSGGWLTGKYRRGEPFPAGSRMTQRPDPYQALVSDATFDRLDRLSALARERGMTLAGLALAWLLSDERVTQIVVGPMRPEHLDPLREALAHPLSTLERRELDA
jgi:aryl-alcohol dehydrogenase-like predicted oxidoreductase